MRKKRGVMIWLIGLIMAIYPLVIHAQEMDSQQVQASTREAQAGVQRMTLSQALAAVTKGNRSLAQSKISKLEAKNKHDETLWMWGPRLHVNAALMGWDDESLLEVVPSDMDLSGLAILPPALLASFKPLMEPKVLREKMTITAQVRLIQPLTPLLKVYQGMRLAEVGESYADVVYDKQYLAISHEVAQLYFKLYYARRAIETLDLAKRSVEEFKVLTQKYLAQGLVKQADVMAIDLRLVEIEKDRLDVQNKMQLASTALAQKLGLSSEVRPTDEFYDMPFEHGKQASSQALVTQLPSVESYVDKAMVNRTELRQLELGQQKAERTKKIEYLNYVPDIGLVLGYDYNHGISIKSTHELYYGLALQWEVWDGLSSAKKAKAASLESQRLAIQMQEARDLIALEIRQKHIALEHAIAKYNVEKQTIALARERLRIEEASFAQGESISANVLKAQTEAQKAALDALDAHIESLTALSELQEAAGILPTFSVSDERSASWIYPGFSKSVSGDTSVEHASVKDVKESTPTQE